MKIPGLTLLSILLLLTTPLFSQRIFIGNEETNRKLLWSDFKGAIDRNSPHHASTSWEVEYRMQEVKLQQELVNTDGLEVSVKMDPRRSWCIPDKTNDALLRHEQLHFDIGMLCMYEFIRTVQQTVFHRKDFDRKLKQIFGEVLQKYHDINNQYDRETEHSNNKEAQQQWEKRIAEQLRLR